MFQTNFRLVLWGVLSLWAAAACAADPWQNARVMPKSDQLLLRSDGEVTGNVYQIEWPATVERIEGQWLRITDHGGYHVPAISGWVSKDEVLKLDEAHDHYMGLLQTDDAPWLHWLMGICLESTKESGTAEEEYLQCLDMKEKPHDADAVRRVVEGQPNMLDAAVRLLRSQTGATKSVDEAVNAANLLKDLSSIAENAGFRRPQVLFERAETLRKAYRLKVAEERRNLGGIKGQVARANSEKNMGTDEDRNLFTEADKAYQLATSAYSAYAHTGPHCWKAYLGEAELWLNRAETLQDEAWSLIAADGGSRASPAASAKSAGQAGASQPASPAAEGESTNDVDTAVTPIDLKVLDVFIKRLQKQKPALADQAEAACVCLAAAVESLHNAVKYFDKVVALSPDLVEAYRDRGLAYYRLAQCEAVLAAFEDSDLKLRSGITNLDRALLDGRRGFEKALNRLVDAKERQALVATEKKDLASVEDAMVKNCIATALKRGDSAANPKKKGEAAGLDKTDLRTVGKTLCQLRADAAELKRLAEREEQKVTQALAIANAELAASCNALNNSVNLQQAKRSARAACDKGCFASAESLKILATIYAGQCNFDRAEYYQKLAVIFVSEDERPAMLQTLEHYRIMGQLVTERKRPKTPPSPPGQAKGSAQPTEE